VVDVIEDDPPASVAVEKQFSSFGDHPTGQARVPKDPSLSLGWLRCCLAAAVGRRSGLGREGQVLREVGTLEELLEDVHDAVAADESHRGHRLGHLLHHGALSEGVERRDEVGVECLRLVDDGLDLGLELLQLDGLGLASDIEASLFRVRLNLGRDGRDFRSCLGIEQLVRDLLGFRLGVGFDDREVELELELGRFRLQRHRGTLRLRPGQSDLAVQLFGLSHEGEVAVGLGQVEGILDDLALGADEELLDLRILQRDAQNLEIVDPHPVLVEDVTRAGRLLAFVGRRHLAEDDVTEGIRAVAVELLHAELLNRVADLGAHVIAQELDVVVDVEPVLRVALEVDSVAQLDVELDEVAGLDLDDVADHVGRRLEEDGAQRVVHRLRLAARQGDDLRRLVVLEHEGSRTLHDAAFAVLADQEHREARPDGRGDRSVVLRVEDDAARRRELRLAIEGVTRQRLGSRLDHHPAGGVGRDGRGDRRVGLVLGGRADVGAVEESRVAAACPHEVLVLDAEASHVDLESLVVARVKQFARLQIESALSDDLPTGIGEEDLRTSHEADDAGLTIEDVASLTGRDGDGVVHVLLAVLDDGVLLAGEVDGLLLTRDEEFIARLVGHACLVGVVRDDSDVDAARRSELLRSELLGLRLVRVGLDGCRHELLGGSREDDGRAVDVALGAALVQKEAVLETLERHGLADVALLATGLLRDDLDAGGRDVEGDVRAADDEELAHRQVLLGRDVVDDRLGLGLLRLGRSRALTLTRRSALRLGLDDGLAPVRLRRFLVVDSDEQVLVAAEIVTLDDLRHLTGPEREGAGSCDVDLLSDSEVGGRHLAGTRRVLVGRVLEDDVPALGSRLERARRLLELDGLEALRPVVEDDRAVRASETGLVGTHEDRNVTLRLVGDEGVLVRGEDHVALAVVRADVIDVCGRCHVFCSLFVWPFRGRLVNVVLLYNRQPKDYTITRSETGDQRISESRRTVLTMILTKGV